MWADVLFLHPQPGILPLFCSNCSANIPQSLPAVFSLSHYCWQCGHCHFSFSADAPYSWVLTLPAIVVHPSQPPHRLPNCRSNWYLPVTPVPISLPVRSASAPGFWSLTFPWLIPSFLSSIWLQSWAIPSSSAYALQSIPHYSHSVIWNNIIKRPQVWNLQKICTDLLLGGFMDGQRCLIHFFPF